VFYFLDQNVKIFRGFVHHRPYFRQFSKKPIQKSHRLMGEGTVMLKC